MKNKYESIYFEVEKDLSKPKSPIYGAEVKEILSSIFVRGKGYKNHSNEPEYYDKFDPFIKGEMNDRMRQWKFFIIILTLILIFGTMVKSH